MNDSENFAQAETFDAQEKERQLKAESESWNTNEVIDAQPGDIPVIDLSQYFQSLDNAALQPIAKQLREACEEVGFFSIIGHQVETSQIKDTFNAIRAFHQLPLDKKIAIKMDRPEWPVSGAGYLPVKNRKLPARDTGNINEAFIVKHNDSVSMADNQWPDEKDAPGFRTIVESYAKTMEKLGKKMLPIYACALELPEDYFDQAFEKPLYRLRMTHYPSAPSTEEFGIAPHVDTSFCTILAQDQPGLTIFSERKKCWIRVPAVENAFVVNTGELLKQWTNDRFISVKHFANNNTSNYSRYSIPFFFNTNQHYKMSCIPGCFSEENPARYPPISYAESQAVVQGE